MEVLPVRLGTSRERCEPRRRNKLRGTILHGLSLALLWCASLPARAQEDRPHFNPGERKAVRKKDAGPRALGVIQVMSDGKMTLVPIAILVNGKFWDASAYKADPVPMALETGTVYEGERAGNSTGLFTVGTALHSRAANTANPWVGTGSWLANGTDVANKPMKAEIVPQGIGSSDEPPRLTKNPSAAKPADKPSGSAPASTGAPAPTSAPSSSSGDEPPRLSRPAQSGSGNSGSNQTGSKQTGSSQTGSSQTGSSPTGSNQTGSSPAGSSPSQPPSDGSKSDDDRPTLKRPGDDKSNDKSGDKSGDPGSQNSSTASSEPPPPASDSGADEGARPRLRRGKPATSFADEEVPGYSKPGVAASAGAAKSSAQPATPVDLVPAISDATGPALHPYNFIWIKGEEDDRRKQLEGMAKQEVRSYLDAQAKARLTPPAAGSKPAPHSASAHPAARKGPEPVLENERFVAYDLWTNNTPVMIFSADAHLPRAAGESAAPSDLQYSVVLVVRPDIYDTLRKLYVGVTDKFHLDLTPRLELVDAVDADGDGRGELLFKEISDAGAGWIVYRATADKLWKMYDSLSPE